MVTLALLTLTLVAAQPQDTRSDPGARAAKSQRATKAQRGTTRKTARSRGKRPALVKGADLKFLGSFDVPRGGAYNQPRHTQYVNSPGIIGYREDLDALYVESHLKALKYVGLIKVPKDLSPSEVRQAEQLKAPIALQSMTDREARLKGLFWDEPTKTLFYNFTMWYNVKGVDCAGMGAMRDGKFFGLWGAAHNNASAGYITRDPGSGRLIVGSSIPQGVATSSLGPSAFRLRLDESKLPAPNSKIPFDPLLFHPYSQNKDTSKYATLSTGKKWIKGMAITGGVCVGGSLLIALDEGERSFYGEAADFQSAFGFAPRYPYKGYHLDRYSPTIWFYSLANCEQASRRGRWWQPKPYEYWKIPQMPPQSWVGGLSLDAKGRRLFVSQRFGNSNKTPRIHVYQIGDGQQRP